MTSNFRYDKYINDERSTSEKILDYNNYLKSHLINKEYAKFETKTDKINEINSDNIKLKNIVRKKKIFSTSARKNSVNF